MTTGAAARIVGFALLLLAVTHRHAGIAMYDQDVFVNVVGGVRIVETAADLPMLLALYSSFRDRPLPDKLFCFGEVGLSGEVRPVPDGEPRIKEAAGHGFEIAVVPAANAPRKTPSGVEVIAARNIRQVLERLA